MNDVQLSMAKETMASIEQAGPFEASSLFAPQFHQGLHSICRYSPFDSISAPASYTVSAPQRTL